MDERQTVWDGLKEGYGAEDIAVLKGISVSEVRAWVRHFRAIGKLPGLYGRAKKKWLACQIENGGL